jgi:hypothetical protein
MKRIVVVLLLFCFFIPAKTFSQANSESPVAHMSFLSELEDNLSQKYMSYMSEMAHGERARKMEKRRQDVINSVKVAIREAGKLRPYKGDASLRDSYKQYWTVLLNVFLEDYHKIMDMEEVAERSYDAMEAILLIQETANEKVDQEYDKMRESFKAFAAKHDVTLTQGQASKLDRKLAKTGKVNKYMNHMFLVYFKSTVQESLAFDALQKDDINGFEQSKASLQKYSIEGLARLDTMKAFGDDGSMITACRKVLEFQKSEAQSKMNTYSEFLLKKEQSEQVKKSYESKPSAQRSQKDIDQFNNSVTEFNKSVAEYNKVNNELNASRDKVMTNWHITKKKFMDRHVPR